jgi:mRNA-degrading endonuclease RelE of RelBE toxin-antitoxin system
MRFDIILAPEAVDDMRHLSGYERGKVRDAIEVHLRHEPTKLSKSRIKRLRGISRPWYRLRVDDLRVFYGVEGKNVRVLGVVAKSNADEWLAQAGERDENGPTVRNEG